MPTTGVRMTGVLLNKFYAMGGRSMDGVGNDFTHPFEYDPSSNTWTIKSATYPDNQVSDMACGVLNDSGTNYIYCVGGSAGGQTTAIDRVFRYDPVTDVINVISSAWPGDADGITLPGGFTVFNNKLYILGGFRINTAMTDSIWEFTPTTNVWVQKTAHLPVPLGYIPTTNLFSGRIYTGGGSTWDGTTIHDSNYAFAYDPVADSISAIPNIPRATGETRAVPFSPLGNSDYMMFVMGGGRDAPNPSNEVDVYDRFSNSWTTFGNFITARRNFASDSAGLCHIYIAGGYASDGVTPLSSMEIFCFPAPTPTATATVPPPSPTATTTVTPTITPPSPSPSPTIIDTPTPTPRVSPTPRPRPTPAPRP